MPTYEVTAENTIFNQSSNSYCFPFSTGYRSTTEEITDNIDGVVILEIDDIPDEVILIENKDPNNNIELYVKNYDYSNFTSNNNDSLSLLCGRSYMAWSKSVPYTLTIPDCTEADDDLLPKKYYCIENECTYVSTKDVRTAGLVGYDTLGLCEENCSPSPSETGS
jgi:hypothetical protein